MHAAVDGRVSAVSEQTAAARPGAGALLRDLDQAPPSELVDVCWSWLARHVAAQACVLLLADYAEASLEPVAGGAAVAHIRPQDLMDSAAGAAYREQRRVTVALDDAGEASAVGAAAGGVCGPTLVVYLPVSVRAERLGVLAVTLSGHDVGHEVGEVLGDVARVLGHVLTGARRYTDRFEMLRRRRELGLAAEIQWELLPSLAFELPAFSIAGTVEPAYEIGGDNFDYAISAHRLTVSVSDAVGHGIRAALLASLAVTAMRNTRRAHCSIVEQAGTANRHLVEQFPGADFVSGLLVPPGLPLGLVASAHYPVHPIQLHPKDRLLLFTDGITEAHRRGERDFGYRRLAAMLAERSHLKPPELVRHLTRAVSESCNGVLSDDATAVCLDWHPPQAPGQ